MTAVFIRPAQPTDAVELSELICENARHTLGEHYSQQQMDTFLYYYSLEQVQDKLRRQAVFCAVEADQIIGTIALEDDWMVGFYTRWGYQGRGIGVALMRHLEAYARAQGLASIQLAASPAGASFYTRYGYEVIETTWMTYFGTDFEETLMIKHLAQGHQ